MKKTILSIITLSLICILSIGCNGNDQANDIAQSIERQNTEKRTTVIEPPSVKQQNKQRVNVPQEMEEYADEFGYYLDQFYLAIDEMRTFFFEDRNNQKRVDESLTLIRSINEHADKILHLRTPHEFEGLHEVHMSALIELDSLEDELASIDVNNEKQIQMARTYYENTVISLKQMQREYKEVLEEFGIN
ncbi:hypothetical protein [Bacillus sp. FJAT-45350]|uniref:hypothetical protein n=1 Tax=Bacillus sp. FJAT-45350 TaxID=2011014 RepID=UPI000BB74412|nr:hypothetical protein [Bacillus sp. FJAT-45350]